MRWENSTHIDAPADVVWRLTLDITDWPSYVPTVRRVDRLDDGPLRVGSSARLDQPGQPTAVWTVTTLEPQQRFAWQSKRTGYTLTGSHVVEPDGNGCRNTLAIDLTGPLAPVLGPLVARTVRRTIATENAAVRAKAESLA
jgi:uncharacterized membrane protein